MNTEVIFSFFNDNEKIHYQNFLSVYHPELVHEGKCNIDIKDIREDNVLGYFLFMASFGKTKHINNLAKYYKKKLILDRDIFWFNFLAQRRHPYSLYRLSYLIQTGFNSYGLHIEKDEIMAFEYTKMAADKMVAAAICKLGLMYEKGIGVELNMNLARVQYKRAEGFGNCFAKCALARFYEEGLGGLSINYSEAYRLYEEAEKKNYRWAKYRIGLMYEEGRNFEVNLEKAYEYYQKAIENGSYMAKYQVGRWYEMGKYFGEVDIKKALVMYEEAATNKEMDAQFQLGDESQYASFYLGKLYEDGEVVMKDLEESRKWYKISALHGSKEAEVRLLQINKN